MGNSFIGFPVPKAKIADMITGSAPPIIHHVDHETGGDDEVDCTGLVGAGGVAFPIRGLWIDDYSTDHTRWTQTFVGSGSLTRNSDRLDLATNYTNPSSALIRRRLRQPIPTLTWDLKRHLVFQAYIDCDDTPTTTIHILTGFPGASNYMGFEVSGGKLRGINGNSGGQSSVEILTFPQAFIGADIVLEAIHFPAEKVEFWVDGILEQTVTTNLPTGTGQADYVGYLKVDNNSTANNVEIEFSHIQLYQEA